MIWLEMTFKGWYAIKQSNQNKSYKYNRYMYKGDLGTK